MKLGSKCTDSEYTPGEGILTLPENTGLSLFLDVDEELTDSPSAVDAVGEVLDEAETPAEKAKAAIKTALANESSPHYDLMTFFMQFHRDDVGPDIAVDLFPGTDSVKLFFIEMADFLRLERSGSLVDGEIGQQAFILGLFFSPETIDELVVVYFDLNKETLCITYEG